MSMTIARRRFLGFAASLGCAVAWPGERAAALSPPESVRLAGLYYVQVELGPCDVSTVAAQRRAVELRLGLDTALEEQWLGAPDQATGLLGLFAYPCGTRMTVCVSPRFKRAGAYVVARGQDDAIEFTCG